jgi:ribosomal protein S18 acetylase RimI-like enzyme
MITVRRLDGDDEPVLALLAEDAAAFEREGRGRPRRPVGQSAAAAHLADPHVLHWVAEENDVVVGHLLCYLERRWVDEPVQLLLYEIGVRHGYRRRGVGRCLIREMERWMTANAVRDVWVLADEEAEPFYFACGFAPDVDQPVQMSRRL